MGYDKDNVIYIDGIPFGYTESAFEMPGDYLMDDEIPEGSLPDMSGWPEDVKDSMMRLEAKESVLQIMKLKPENWRHEISRLTMEAGALRHMMSFEYLSAYDRHNEGSLNVFV